MSKIKSIFGAYADRLQVMIDNSQAKFAPVWYQQYFPFAPAQQSLTFTSAIGRARIEAAASVVNRDSATPMRSRQGLEKLTGDIPAIKEMFKMAESDYRDWMTMQAIGVDDATKKQQLLDFMFGDVKKVGDSAQKRLDIMCLEAVSTGKVSLDISNNPDGLVLANPIDLLMPATNKKTASVTWGTPTTATPISDIEAVVLSASDRGISFEKILMSKSLFLKLKKTKEVLDTMTAYFYGPKSTGNSTANAVATLDKINEFMGANQLPMIELIDMPVGIEKDGMINTIRPFNENNVSFIPAGPLGEIKNAIAIEQIKPVTSVSYASFNRGLISKWSENEPFGEWTKVELNAFPAFTAIDSVYILTALF
jgi:hypothetical protein